MPMIETDAEKTKALNAIPTILGHLGNDGGLFVKTRRPASESRRSVTETMVSFVTAWHEAMAIQDVPRRVGNGKQRQEEILEEYQGLSVK